MTPCKYKPVSSSRDSAVIINRSCISQEEIKTIIGAPARRGQQWCRTPSQTAGRAARGTWAASGTATPSAGTHVSHVACSRCQRQVNSRTRPATLLPRVRYHNTRMQGIEASVGQPMRVAGAGLARGMLTHRFGELKKRTLWRGTTKVPNPRGVFSNGLLLCSSPAPSLTPKRAFHACIHPL